MFYCETEVAMIAVIFEVFAANGRKDDYLEHAALLRSELECMDGFISVERFQSLTDPDKLLSLSLSGETRKRSLAGAQVLVTALRNRPAARASSETIVCASLPSFATMACPSAASRHRPTVVLSTTCRTDACGP
jgi:hypothetical protein